MRLPRCIRTTSPSNEATFFHGRLSFDPNRFDHAFPPCVITPAVWQTIFYAKEKPTNGEIGFLITYLCTCRLVAPMHRSIHLCAPRHCLQSRTIARVAVRRRDVVTKRIDISFLSTRGFLFFSLRDVMECKDTSANCIVNRAITELYSWTPQTLFARCASVFCVKGYC